MSDTNLLVAVLVVALLLLAGLAGLFVYLARKPAGGAELSVALQNLTQSLNEGRTQIALVTERVSRLEPMREAVDRSNAELVRLAERVGQVDLRQSASSQDLGRMASSLLQTHEQSTVSLSQSTATLKSEIARVQQEIASIQARSAAREDVERRTADAVVRLETVIAGTHSKGAAGENIVELVFSRLPIEWQVRNFTVKGRPVEFGLRLPNGLIVPIDSKWAATDILEQFIVEQDPRKRLDLKARLEDAVLKKAAEVRKYLDPNVTVSFGVAVIPDAVYDMCSRAQADCFQQHVVLVSYTMFVPYLMLVFQTALASGRSIDFQKLAGYLDATAASLQGLQEELDGRFSRAMTMLDNSRTDMRAHISKASTSLTALQLGAGSAAVPEALPSGEVTLVVPDEPETADSLLPLPRNLRRGR